MKRVVVAGCTGLFVVALLGACDDGGERHRHRHRHAHPNHTCTIQSSCGTCTPVLGCGWCFTSGGGVCVSDPDVCPKGSLGFTWEPPGCSNVPDGGDPADAQPVRSLADAQVDELPGLDDEAGSDAETSD